MVEVRPVEIPFYLSPPNDVAHQPMKPCVLFSAALLAVSTLSVSAANWPQFRGPNHDGSTPETGLPESFSRSENVKWAADMPDRLPVCLPCGGTRFS